LSVKRGASARAVNRQRTKVTDSVSAIRCQR
jgi:hypothetical protein